MGGASRFRPNADIQDKCGFSIFLRKQSFMLRRGMMITKYYKQDRHGEC